MVFKELKKMRGQEELQVEISDVQLKMQNSEQVPGQRTEGSNSEGKCPRMSSCPLVETEVFECWFQSKQHGPYGGACYKCRTSGFLPSIVNANLCFNKPPGDS